MALGKYKIPRELQDQDLWLKFFTKKQLLICAVALAACIGICILFNSLGIVIIGVIISLFIIITTVAILFLKMPQRRHMHGGGYGLDVLAARVIKKKLFNRNKYIYTYLAQYEYTNEEEKTPNIVKGLKKK